MSTRKTISILLAAALATVTVAPTTAQEAQKPPPSPPPSRQQQLGEAIAQLPAKYQQWVRSVIGLMTVKELEFFLALKQNYRRDAFMEAFWGPRDPDPQTPKNELRERWESYRDAAGGFPYGDPRFLLYLLNGPPGGWTLPDGRPVARCFSRTKELEIWYYGGSERTTRDFAVIFQRTALANPYEVYLPGGNLRPVQRTGGLPVQDVQQLCAEDLLSYTLYEIQRIGGYDRLLKEVMTPPLPSLEWLSDFKASVAELPEGAETFEVAADVAYLARNQSRTAVRVMLVVDRKESPGRRFDGQLFHDFVLVGEVIKDGDLFETVRYRFEGPTPEDATAIPLGFTRYLRPGPATLRILLEDVYAKRYAQVVRELDVPSPEGLPPIEAPAIASQETTGPSLHLVAPPGDALAGKVRFSTSSRGDLDKVTFYLDGKEILSKTRPPYSVELDLGEAAEPHRVRVVGFVGDREAATDQIWLNQGAQRFRVGLIEPREGGIYPGGFTARVAVNTPEGSPPDRVEIFVDDELVATLRVPPFAHTVALADTKPVVVRAVAYLTDGSWTEDAVLVNANAFGERIEVRLVELSALVTDKEGRPLTGLSREQFHLFDGGAPQEIERFEEASGAPVRLGLLIDRSASMEPHLASVAEAARGFAAAALKKPDDRVAVFSFANELSVDAGFTGNAAQVEKALAELLAHGGTAFYDSFVEALNNFGDAPGQSALVVFTDGRDETSKLTFEQTLETARRAGVTVWAVGLEESFTDKDARRALEDLVSETGGRAYFLRALDELPGVYDAILSELGNRYLIAFEPSASGDEFRPLRLEVDVEGARVRTRRGYYP